MTFQADPPFDRCESDSDKSSSDQPSRSKPAVPPPPTDLYVYLSPTNNLDDSANLNADLEADLQIDANPSAQPAWNSRQPLYFLSVNYYSAALLSDLLHSLEVNAGIVIVNNSPRDRVVHELAGQTYAGGVVTVLDAPENGGFGAGCNIGLQWIYARSPGALVWLINPDARLLTHAVSAVRECLAQKSETAILGTSVIDANGKLWFGAGRFNRWTGSISSHLKPATKRAIHPVPARWVSGCSMVLNFDLLGHCPQFDDAYFLYYEDCDLCERYFQQGYVIAVTSVPLVIHAVSRITSRYPQPKFAYATFSKLTFLRRHATPLALWLNLAYLFAQSLWLALSDRTAAQGRWQGLKRFLTQRS